MSLPGLQPRPPPGAPGLLNFRNRNRPVRSIFPKLIQTNGLTVGLSPANFDERRRCFGGTARREDSDRGRRRLDRAGLGQRQGYSRDLCARGRAGILRRSQRSSRGRNRRNHRWRRRQGDCVHRGCLACRRHRIDGRGLPDGLWPHRRARQQCRRCRNRKRDRCGGSRLGPRVRR